MSPSILDILNPTAFLAGLEIREPVTSLTDLLTAVVCLFAWFQLRDSGNNTGHLLFRRYFFLMFLGLTSAGIIGHAAQSYLSPDWKAIGWVLTALALMCIEWHAIDRLQPLKPGKWPLLVRILVVAHFSALMVTILLPPLRDFFYVRINSTIALVGITFPLAAIHYQLTRHPGSRWLLLAILWGILPALVFNFQWSVNHWLNYHDISHLLMSVFSLIMLKSAREFSQPAIQTSNPT